VAVGDEGAHAELAGEGERFAVVSLPPAGSKRSGSLAMSPSRGQRVGDEARVMRRKFDRAVA
jgi:hypothetical protein